MSNVTILQEREHHIGISQDTVYFTTEPSVQEAITNGSNVISVIVRGSNEGVVWMHHTSNNMVTDLRHYPEHYERFLNAAIRIYNREVGA